MHPSQRIGRTDGPAGRLDLRAAVGANDLFYRFRGEVEGQGIDIGKQWLCAAAQNGADRGEEAEGGGDNSVAWAYICGSECEPKCVGSAGTAYSVRYLAGDGGSALKGFDSRAQNKLLRSADLFDGGQNLIADSGVLPGEVKHLNGLKSFRCHRPMVNRYKLLRVSAGVCCV